MGTTSEVLTNKGTDVIPPGVRFTIDPQLRDQNGLVLNPNDVSVSRGAICASENGDGTFDLQNITDAEQTIQWTASHLHSIQDDDAAALLINTGAVSANAPLVIGGGGSSKSTFVGPLSAGANPLSAAQVDNTVVLLDSTGGVQSADLPVLTIAEDECETEIKREGAFGASIVAGAGQTVEGLASYPLASDGDAALIKFNFASLDWKVL